MTIIDNGTGELEVPDDLTNAAAQAWADKQAERRRYIGGSDVAAVMGLSPWMTPVELWELKTARVLKEDTPEKRKIFKRGHKLEPFIREMVIEKLRDEWGLTVEVAAINERYVDDEHDFLACEIDFELIVSGTVYIGEEEVKLVHEHINCDAKSVTGFARKKWGDIGTDEVPIEYAAQFMHGLGITGRRYCLVAALRSFDDVDVFWVQADTETIEAMRQRCVEFWLHVQEDTPPDPVRFSDLTKLFPKPVVDLKEADEEAAALVADLKRVKAAKKDLEEREKDLQFEVGKLIGDSVGLKLPGATKPIVTWNAQQRTDFDVKRFRADHAEMAEAYSKPSTIRVMLVK